MSIRSAVQKRQQAAAHEPDLSLMGVRNPALENPGSSQEGRVTAPRWRRRRRAGWLEQRFEVIESNGVVHRFKVVFPSAIRHPGAEHDTIIDHAFVTIDSLKPVRVPASGLRNYLEKRVAACGGPRHLKW